MLVCNEGDGSLSIIAVADLQVRKVVRRGLAQPFDVAIIQRQTNFGYQRGVYWAYVLDRNGRLAFFESGPSGAGGFGFDTIVGYVPGVFSNPQGLQPDPRLLTGGVWVLHENQVGADGQPTGLTGGAASLIHVESALFGIQPLAAGEQPSLRDLGFEVLVSLGSDQLGGTPLDLAFDDLVNLGVYPGVGSPFSAGVPATVNSKAQVRAPSQLVVPTNQASFLFVAVQGASGEWIDVFDLRASPPQLVDTNPFVPGTQSIPAPGALVLADYFRQ